MSNRPSQRERKEEITYFVNARQKTYLYSTEIYIPFNPYEKIEKGYEQSKPKIKTRKSSITSEEELLERSIRRARTAVKDIIFSNVFELFATFTFRTDRDNPDICRDKLNGWLKRQRKNDKSFQYVVVSEFHKDGESLHFHALVNNYKGKIVRAINPKTNKPLVKGRRKVFDFPSYTLGHSEVYYIGDTEEDKIRSGFYLMKYLRKDMPVFKNKKRYWSSRGLSKPTIIENPDEWYFGVTPDHKIEADTGIYLFFDNKRPEVPKE